MYTLRYLFVLLRFTFARHPLLYLCLFLSAASVGIELLAMTSLVPLSYLMLGQTVPETDRLVRVLRWLNLSPTAQTLLLSFTLIFALRIVTHFGCRGLIMRMGRRILTQFCTQAFANVICCCSLREVEGRSIGYYISLTGDESARASNIVVQVLDLAGVALLAMLYYAAICFFSWTAGAAVLAFLFVAGLFSLRLLYATKRLSSQAVAESRAANSVQIDAFNGFRSVKAFSAEKFVTQRNYAQMTRYQYLLWRIEVLNAAIRFGPVLLLLVGFGGYVQFGMRQSYTEADWAMLLTIVVFVLRLFPLLGQCVMAGARMIADIQTGKDVTDVLRMQLSKPLNRGTLLAGPVRTIAVRDVSFGYAPENPVLQRLNANFVAGKSYAIMGPSGTGKSTLTNLLLNFYRPDAGGIFVDGVSMTDIDEADFRRRVILLEQQTAIFNDTLRNNIAFGQTCTDEEIAWAARTACIDDFVAALPEGYLTAARYQGNNLSGGQRQRLGLARALIRRPEVLILDEGTSALDKTTRDRVVQNLLAEFKQRILIFVTHDAELAECVDHVVHLEPARTHASIRQCG